MGKTYCNAYGQFSQLLSAKSEIYFEEIKKNCEVDSVKKEFYELCKCIVDIALNAKKCKPEDNQVQAVFSEMDINIAKNKVIEFVRVYEIKDSKNFLNAVEDIYPYAIEWDDKRGTCAVVFDEKEKSKRDLSRIGGYYSFTQLPNNIWNEIKDEILEELKQDK